MFYVSVGPPPSGPVMNPADLLAPMSASSAPPAAAAPPKPKPNYTNVSKPVKTFKFKSSQIRLVSRKYSDRLCAYILCKGINIYR